MRVFAQVDLPITDVEDKFSASGLVGQVLSKFLPVIFGIAGFITIIMIVISGIQFITSSGNPEAAGAARGRLIFALIGFGLIVTSFVILQLIDQVFLETSIITTP